MVANETSRQIEIRAEVLAYREHSLRQQFDDGASAAFDASLLRVDRPAALSQRRLFVYQNRPAAADSPWRRVHGIVNFRVPADLLEPGVMLFDAAAQELRLLDERGDK